MAIEQTWVDRAIGSLSPRWQLKRLRARVASDLVQRSYEAASIGRRTQGWRRSSTDANAIIGPSLARLRDAARELVRNNPYAESALATIADHAVGWGIVPTAKNSAFDAWAKSTACDAHGRHDLAGLQKLVVRTVVESGEILVRRRWRRPDDGLPLPFQLQLLEPDYLDTAKDNVQVPGGGFVIQGVEFNAIGRRVAYWMFREHPGALTSSFAASERIPASEVQHVGKGSRPGQVRYPSWFAPVLLRFKDFDEYEDATLMKQKIAACLAVITTDVDGSAAPLGTATEGDPAIDSLEPGMIMNIPPGRSVDVVEPPRVAEHAEFTQTTLRAIATGLGVTYEDLTGDYTELPFSAARMSRLRHWARVEDWRWRMLIPQFLNPVWAWAMEAASVMSLPVTPSTDWTAPPMPMIEPDKEGLAYMRNIRAGIQTLSDAIRERGYVPDTFLAEMAADNARLDKLGLLLDSDPRHVSQAGQLQGAATASSMPPPAMGGRGSGDDWGARFADFLSSLPEDRAVDVLAAMFGERR
jgi:lambda family phage portal protein